MKKSIKLLVVTVFAAVAMSLGDALAGGRVTLCQKYVI